MKIAATSDLHSDGTPQNYKLLPYLAAQVERLTPDVFVLAGDIANTLRGWENALLPFKPLQLLKLIVPGNQDGFKGLAQDFLRHSGFGNSVARAAKNFLR